MTAPIAAALEAKQLAQPAFTIEPISELQADIRKDGVKVASLSGEHFEGYGERWTVRNRAGWKRAKFYPSTRDQAIEKTLKGLQDGSIDLIENAKPPNPPRVARDAFRFETPKPSLRGRPPARKRLADILRIVELRRNLEMLLKDLSPTDRKLVSEVETAVEIFEEENKYSPDVETLHMWWRDRS